MEDGRSEEMREEVRWKWVMERLNALLFFFHRVSWLVSV